MSRLNTAVCGTVIGYGDIGDGDGDILWLV